MEEQVAAEFEKLERELGAIPTRQLGAVIPDNTEQMLARVRQSAGIDSSVTYNAVKMAARQNAENKGSKVQFSDQTFHFDTRKGGVFSGIKLRWRVPQLNSADAVRKSSGFNVGNNQLKSWGRWAVGVGALTLTAVVGAFVIADLKNISGPADSAFNPRIYSTQPGQRAKVTLANGNVVTIGPATILKVSDSYVELSGDALFKIQHSESHPFTILSHGVTTRVLGTEFVVRAYDASRVRIAVHSGKVSVQSPVVTANNAVTVSSGEAATVALNAIPMVAKINDMATDFAWASGDLILRDVPLGEALTRLSRWYGLEFRVDDSTLLNLNIESEFPASFDVRRLNAFARALGVQVRRSSNVITLSRK